MSEAKQFKMLVTNVPILAYDLGIKDIWFQLQLLHYQLYMSLGKSNHRIYQIVFMKNGIESTDSPHPICEHYYLVTGDIDSWIIT